MYGYPVDIALDGSGNVWKALQGGITDLAEMSNTGAILSGPDGYFGSFTNTYFDDPCRVVIDGSGDVWVLHCGSPGSSVNLASVNEYIGVATPVITPLVAGLPTTPTADGSSDLGTRP